MSTAGCWTSRGRAAAVINGDRMWHYIEGIKNWAPIWSRHGIRILPGPSSLWFDARGKRLPAPLFPGFDTLGALATSCATGHDYSWFVLNGRIIGRNSRCPAPSRIPISPASGIGWC